MKKFLITSVLLLLGNSCGQYTNLPAQYHVEGTSEFVALVTYDSNRNANVKLPKIKVKGEPGSIGVNFDTMNITYSVGDVSATQVKVAYRVDSSHFRDEKGNIIVGGGTFELPVVSPRVIDYGKRQGASNISANVVLSGLDDANWPTTLEFGINRIFTNNCNSSYWFNCFFKRYEINTKKSSRKYYKRFV